MAQYPQQSLITPHTHTHTHTYTHLKPVEQTLCSDTVLTAKAHYIYLTTVEQAPSNGRTNRQVCAQESYTKKNKKGFLSPNEPWKLREFKREFKRELIRRCHSIGKSENPILRLRSC